MKRTTRTLSRFLIEEKRRFNGDANCTALINDVRLACKRIAALIGKGSLAVAAETSDPASAPGDAPMNLGIMANDIFLRTTEWGGQLAGIVTEQLELPYAIPEDYPRGQYLLLFNPLDGSTDIDVNMSVGSIFSVLRCPDGIANPVESDFLQCGAQQVCAGYAIYGPTTMLVITTGRGVNGFTLDREIGEFMLTHPDLRIAEETTEFAINASNERYWEPAVQRYVKECLAGEAGPRGREFHMRWIASLVAETHRVLMRGGVFLYPRDRRDLGAPGHLRLAYEANPIAFLIEQAGGRASTGEKPILQIKPDNVHQRIGLVFGSRNEVERIESFHLHHNDFVLDEPLFGSRSLFRTSV